MIPPGMVRGRGSALADVCIPQWHVVGSRSVVIAAMMEDEEDAAADDGTRRHSPVNNLEQLLTIATHELFNLFNV